MTVNNPTSVIIDGREYPIRNKCDYRVILDCIDALNDTDLPEVDRMRCALYIFYEDVTQLANITEAINQMYNVIRGGEPEPTALAQKPAVMSWKHDFARIAPAVNRVLGYEVRDPDRYVHWYTLLGAYGEIGECTFSTIVSIRMKRMKGKKLDKWEREYLRDHWEQIELPIQLTPEERAEFDAPW